MPSGSDVTRVLHDAARGDADAARRLLPLVYDELRKLAASRMANESPAHTLQATALVHDAYVRLVDVDVPQQWAGRAHFFAAAAEAMRRILVDHARRRGRLKRGGHSPHRVDLETIEVTAGDRGDDLVALDDALTALSEQHPEIAQLVKLRYFGGLTQPEAVEALAISMSTADRNWAFAKAWLRRHMDAEAANPRLPNAP